MTRPRGWGFWTVGKLDILQNYLSAFTTASKSATETVYLDLFAGQSTNVQRETGEEIRGSAAIALSVEDPPFTTLRLIDLEHADDLREQLAPMVGGRDAEFIQEDCNTAIGSVLGRLSEQRGAPAFAFIDPNGPDCWWATLEELAGFKAGFKYKVELWVLFPVDMFTRFLRVDGGEVRSEDIDRISRMFGTDSWQAIYEDRLEGVLEPSEARAEYVNLMRWRLINVLGYEWAHSFDVYTDRRPIYSMVFATDHQAGNDIMSHLYAKALSEFPGMRQDALDRQRGAMRLFDPEPERVQYDYEPPLPPYGDARRSTES